MRTTGQWQLLIILLSFACTAEVKSQDAGIWPGHIGAANPPRPARKPEVNQAVAPAAPAATTAIAAVADKNRGHAAARVPSTKTTRQFPDNSAKIAPHSGQVYLQNHNPHQPLLLTWQVLGPDLDQVLFTTSKIAPPGTWWPDLAFCLKQVLSTLGSTPNQIRSYGFYCCPEHNKQSVCGGPAAYYCAKWSCVSSNDGDWKWDSEYTLDRATFSFANSGPERYVPMTPYGRIDCRPADLDRVLIKFTDNGKNYDVKAWIKGMRWGVVFNRYGSKPGSSVMVRLSLSSPPAQPVGPNVLADTPPPDMTPIPTDTENRLFSLMQGAFLVLNRTNPNITQSCWLCYASSPPYYEGIAQTRNYNKTSDSSQCPWGENRKLTLTAVSGSGLCLGQVPHDKQHLCNQTQIVQPTGSNQYLVPPIDTVWACNTGLTPCVSTSVFDNSKDYCILVQLVPRLLYHDDSSFVDEFDHRVRWKREPITLTFAVLMGLGIAAGVGTGTAALIQTPDIMKSYEQLWILISDP